MEVAGKRMDDDAVSEFCEPCRVGNVTTQADGYCNDCEEYMCQACFQSHVKMKVLRNHVLGALNAGRKQGTQSQIEKCKKHKTENIKYYCRSHDSVACGDCLLFDHRKCEPEPEFIRDLAKNVEESSDFKNILKEVESLEEFKAEIELALGRNRQKNTEFHDKAIHEIQKCRAEIKTWLENVTSKIEVEEMEIWKTNEVMTSKLEDWIKIINDMKDEVRDEISTEKFTSENLFIRVIECKNKLSEFATKTVPEIESNLDIKSFAFEPNPKLFVLTKLANFGIIRLGRGIQEFQASQEVRQNNMRGVDGPSNVLPLNLRDSSSSLTFNSRTKAVTAYVPQDNYVKEKVNSVREVVSGRSNNEIILVLQFYDYNVEKTIQAYLEDGAKEALQEWKNSGTKPVKKRKNKKKALPSQPVELPKSPESVSSESGSAASFLANGDLPRDHVMNGVLDHDVNMNSSSKIILNGPLTQTFQASSSNKPTKSFTSAPPGSKNHYDVSLPNSIVTGNQSDSPRNQAKKSVKQSDKSRVEIKETVDVKVIQDLKTTQGKWAKEKSPSPQPQRQNHPSHPSHHNRNQTHSDT